MFKNEERTKRNTIAKNTDKKEKCIKMAITPRESIFWLYDESWEPLIKNSHFRSKIQYAMRYLDHLPISEECGYAYFPERRNIFRFMQQNLNEVKCAILGMEPYASWYMNEYGKETPEANGRAFDPDSVTDWQQKFRQSSLRNMLKAVYYNQTGEDKGLAEIRTEIELGKFGIHPPKKWFDRLEQQGVMFLNASLTVLPDEPASHTKLWEDVMTDVIRYIDENADVKWLLFGNDAQARVRDVLGEDRNNLYCCCHPRLPQFVKENIFEKVPEINWCC